MLLPQGHIIRNLSEGASAHRYVGDVKTQLSLCKQYNIDLMGYDKMICIQKNIYFNNFNT